MDGISISDGKYKGIYMRNCLCVTLVSTFSLLALQLLLSLLVLSFTTITFIVRPRIIQFCRESASEVYLVNISVFLNNNGDVPNHNTQDQEVPEAVEK